MSFIQNNQLGVTTGLRIYLIRHAESTSNRVCSDRPGEIETLHDPLLSMKGCEQAHLLASYIKRHSHLSQISESIFYSVYCSAMHRALLTSQYLQYELEINPEIWVDLHEVKGCRELNNTFPGLKRSEIEKKFPGFVIPDECTEEGWFLRDTVESDAEGWERAGCVWEKLKAMGSMAEYQGKSIIIVAHGLFLDFLFGRICGRSMKGGMSLVWIRSQKPVIFFVDRIEHLVGMPLGGGDGEIDNS